MDFDAYIKDLIALYGTLGQVTIKPINYGMQLTITYDSQRATLSVYNGKNGLKEVWGGKDSSLKTAAMALRAGGSSSGSSRASTGGPRPKGAMALGQGTTLLLEDLPGFDGGWIGSDESGKGDFFGPLVVAAVYLDRESAYRLIDGGIRDCKAITDKRLPPLEQLVKATAPAYSVLVMKPASYNMRYQQLKDQGGNLNHLLGLGHQAAISRVMEQRPSCHFALIDQFTKSTRVIKALESQYPSLRVTQRPKGEEDIAVAAASVLARAAFLTTMAQLATMAGVAQLPKGGGAGATAVAQGLAERLGRDQLANFVKLHFANYKKLV